MNLGKKGNWKRKAKRVMKNSQNLESCAGKRKVNPFLDEKLNGINLEEFTWKRQE